MFEKPYSHSTIEVAWKSKNHHHHIVAAAAAAVTSGPTQLRLKDAEGAHWAPEHTHTRRQAYARIVATSWTQFNPKPKPDMNTHHRGTSTSTILSTSQRWVLSQPVSCLPPAPLPDTTWPGKTWQDMAWQDKTCHDRTRQDKTRQDMTRHGRSQTWHEKTRQDTTWLDMAGHGKKRIYIYIYIYIYICIHICTLYKPPMCF